MRKPVDLDRWWLLLLLVGLLGIVFWWPVQYGLKEVEDSQEAIVMTTTLAGAIWHHASVNTEGQDIYYYWHRGGLIADGINPYECASDDTCINHKNPGHFPLFYWLSAGVQWAGYTDYPEWIAFWRPIFVAAYVSVAGLLFAMLWWRGHVALALFAAFFWLGNRWSLYVVHVNHVDFLAIFFAVLSYAILARYWRLALLLFGVSLALKQVAVFLVPIYLIMIWQRRYRQPRAYRHMLLDLICLGSIPALCLAPFILDNHAAVIKGLLFSVTRYSEADFGAPSLSSILYIRGSVASASATLVLMGLVYLGFYKKQITLASAASLIMAVFLGFNTVIFNQYFVWLLPWLPLAAGELLTNPEQYRHTA